MLSKNDITMLHGMFGKLLKENNEIFGRELKREIRDEMHSVVNAAIAASESRVIARLEAKIENVKEEIIDTLDRTVYPIIHRYGQEIAQLRLQHGSIV